MLTVELLRYAGEAMPAEGSGRVVAALRPASDKEVEWALRAGLGPMLHRATRGWGGDIPPPLANALLAAELTAQVRHECKIDTAKRVIDICHGLQAPIILLKGIGISGQCYPAGHLRPMSDIDVLVPADVLPSIETALLRRGFLQGPCKVGQDFHHGEPLFDAERQVWVELHRSLFPADSRLSEGRLFSTASITERCVVATALEERAVGRLCDELQLIYIASYWTRDLSMHPIDPSLVMPLVDAACLLAFSGDSLDWDRLFSLLDNPIAAASLLILLTYLAKHAIAPVPLDAFARLAATRSIAGRLESAILVAMAHRYLNGGRPFRPFNSWHVWTNLIRPGSPALKLLSLPWNILFPPSYSQRYSMAFQQRRIARWLGSP